MMETDLPDGRPARRVSDEEKMRRINRVMNGQESAPMKNEMVWTKELPELPESQRQNNHDRWSQNLTERKEGGGVVKTEHFAMPKT
jgi:hypothetical protein